ncbi:PREDICTED: chitinase-like, partial [Rhagoletis zephyria]|uniref:chitinase-like n=1 Tax=Rhagoletis zephyria TaxID=28612 RepID=UPI000811A896
MKPATTTLSLLVASFACLGTVTVIDSVAGNSIKAAPYFMPLDNDPQSIDDIVAHSGIRHFIFAFALATNGGQCLPVWDGAKGQPVAEDTRVLEMVRKVRAHGGDISISFGGYNGVELGHACHSVEELAKSYQLVIDKYQLTHVDFDIEGDDLGPEEEENRRFQAIQILKRNSKAAGKELHVTLTLPCTTVGLSLLGKDEIKRAIAVQPDLIDLYKIMAFDYGGQGASMAADVEHIMEMVHEQLKTLRTDLKSDAEVYAATGMILMNGHTDQAFELFTLDTFSKLLEYAQAKKLGRLSYWSLNRDRPCPEGKTLGWAAGICSSIPQQPWEFTKIIAKFDPSNGNPNHQTDAPRTTPTDTPTVTTAHSSNTNTESP